MLEKHRLRRRPKSFRPFRSATFCDNAAWRYLEDLSFLTRTKVPGDGRLLAVG